MRRRSLLLTAIAGSLTACGTKLPRISMNDIAEAKFTRIETWPEVGRESSAELGTTLVKTYLITELPALQVNAKTRHIANYRSNLRMALDLQPGEYVLHADSDAGGKFFRGPKLKLAYESKDGFTDFEDLDGGIYIESDGSPMIYWTWEGARSSQLASLHNANFLPTKIKRIPKATSFQRELVYTGTSQATLSVLYREFASDFARPAFSQDLRYDLAKGSVIGYKGARFEVISTDNTSIKYRVLAPLE